MFGRLNRLGSAILIGLGLGACGPEPLDSPTMDALYAEPLSPPEGPLAVYHLGHSLVGRDMPAMLAQLAGEEYRYESQLGWGTTMKAHFEPDEPINGFEAENDHPRYRDAKDAIGSGDYDAVVLTEMVEIRAAIKYFDSGEYLARWARLAREGRADVRIYLYETWHPLDDEEGWFNRLDADLGRYWEDEILARALAADEARRPIYVIPAGQVLARFLRAVESRGGVAGIADPEDLFKRNEDGTLDVIHINDLGAYLVALTHYAVLTHQNPVGLPHALKRADGTPATAPSPEAARLMQETVWEVVTSYPKTGVAPTGDS